MDVSILSKLPLSSHETWLLPQVETLCMIRYLDDSHGATTSNGEDGKETKYKEQEEKLPENLQPPDDRDFSDIGRLKLQPDKVPACECYSIRTTDKDRMSDALQPLDDRPPLEI